MAASSLAIRLALEGAEGMRSGLEDVRRELNAAGRSATTLGDAGRAVADGLGEASGSAGTLRQYSLDASTAARSAALAAGSLAAAGSAAGGGLDDAAAAAGALSVAGSAAARVSFLAASAAANLGQAAGDAAGGMGSAADAAGGLGDAAAGAADGMAGATDAAGALGEAAGDAGESLDDAGDGAGRAARGIDRAGDSTREAGTAMEKFTNFVSGAATAIVATYAAFMGLGEVWEGLKDAAQLRTIERQLTSFGVSLERLRDIAGGLVARNDLAEFASALGRAGLGRYAEEAVEAAVALSSSGADFKQALDKIKAAFIEAKPEQLVEEFGLQIETTGDAAKDFKATLEALNSVVKQSGGVAGNALREYTSLEDMFARASEQAYKLADSIIRLRSYLPDDPIARTRDAVLDAAGAVAEMQRKIGQLTGALARWEATAENAFGREAAINRLRKEIAEKIELLEQERSKQRSLEQQADALEKDRAEKNAAREAAFRESQAAENIEAVKRAVEDLRAAKDEEYAIRLRARRQIEELQALSLNADVQAEANRAVAIGLVREQEQRELEALRAARAEAMTSGVEFANIPAATVDFAAFKAFYDSLEDARREAVLAGLGDTGRAIEEANVAYAERVSEINEAAREAEIYGLEAHTEMLVLALEERNRRIDDVVSRAQQERLEQQYAYEIKLAEGAEAQIESLQRAEPFLAAATQMWTQFWADLGAGVDGSDMLKNAGKLLGGLIQQIGTTLLSIGTALALIAPFASLPLVAPIAAQAAAAAPAFIAGGLLLSAAGAALGGALGASGGSSSASSGAGGASPGLGGQVGFRPPESKESTIIINVEGGIDTSDEIAKRVAAAVRRGTQLGYRMA